MQSFHGKPGIRGRASASECEPISHASPALGNLTLPSSVAFFSGGTQSGYPPGRKEGVGHSSHPSSLGERVGVHATAAVLSGVATACVPIWLGWICRGGLGGGGLALTIRASLLASCPCRGSALLSCGGLAGEGTACVPVWLGCECRAGALPCVAAGRRCSPAVHILGGSSKRRGSGVRGP